MQPLDPARAAARRADDRRGCSLPIMPEKNRKEFADAHDTDFAYEIAGPRALPRERLLRSQRPGRRLSGHSRRRS